VRYTLLTDQSDVFRVMVVGFCCHSKMKESLKGVCDTSGLEFSSLSTFLQLLKSKVALVLLGKNSDHQMKFVYFTVLRFTKMARSEL